MHGIIAMSRELQDMLPPHTKGSHAVAIISGTPPPGHAASGRPCQFTHMLTVLSTTDCADHLLSLVNDILDFERIECNQLELEQIPFSIVTETRKVVDMVRFPAGTPHLDLRAASCSLF
jgi:signal transduction histidine kinase